MHCIDFATRVHQGSLFVLIGWKDSIITETPETVTSLLKFHGPF